MLVRYACASEGAEVCLCVRQALNPAVSECIFKVSPGAVCACAACECVFVCACAE